MATWWNRFARGTVSVTLGAAVLVVAAPPPSAHAHTPRVEVESGAITTPTCGDNGETMSVQAGGTGQVVFFPAYGCAVRFAGNDLRYHLTTIHYTTSGVAGTICGQFWWGGAVHGESERVCAGPGEPVVAGVSVEQRYVGAYTLYWMPDWPGQRYVNAYVDFVENSLRDTLVEAEWGTLGACSGGGSMSKIWDGESTVVYQPGTGCTQTFPQQGRYTLDTVTYYVSGTSGSGCGYFSVAGSVTGRSETVCSAAGERVTARFTTTNIGTGDYTVTWHPPSTNPYLAVRVDGHTRTRVRTVEAESGWFHNGSTCGEEPAYVDGDVAVYTGIGCRQVFSVDSPVVVDSITVHLDDGEGGPTCGWFDLVGSVNGGTEEFCATPGEVVNVRVFSSSARTGAFTLSWFAGLDGSPYVDAHVDSFTVVPAVAEAETATVVARTCGGDTTTGPTADGTGFFFAGSGCAARLTSPGSTVVRAARFRISGLPASNVCGYFSFSGAISGRSDTRCVDLLAGDDTYADVPVTTTSTGRVGGTYTVTWVTTTGTLVTTDATLDRLALVSG